jgi:peroxiredoxin
MAVSRDAPNFKLKDTNDVWFSLSDYRDKKPVLLFFWTTWCPYCRDEMKQLTEKYFRLAEKGMKVLSINVGESTAKVQGFIKNKNLPFTVLLDQDTNVSAAYNLVGIPTFVLINEKGKVVFVNNYFPYDSYGDLLLK